MYSSCCFSGPTHPTLRHLSELWIKLFFDWSRSVASISRILRDIISQQIFLCSLWSEDRPSRILCSIIWTANGEIKACRMSPSVIKRKTNLLSLQKIFECSLTCRIRAHNIVSVIFLISGLSTRYWCNPSPLKKIHPTK